MGKRWILLDDLDGKELPDGTQPIRVALGRRSWNVYLSDDNQKKLYDALEPFTKDAEPADTTRELPAPRRRRGNRSLGSDDGQSNAKEVRQWAQANNIKDDRGRPVGDRGRIRPEIFTAWEEANK